MCGIVGYIGKKEAAPLLIEGLRRLEYRGYDSAGVCILADGALHVRKQVGRVASRTFWLFFICRQYCSNTRRPAEQRKVA